MLKHPLYAKSMLIERCSTAKGESPCLIPIS
jgi:hypothetical protein